MCELMPMEQANLIDQLGGTGAVAAELGQKDNTVSMWRSRGIPWRWRPSVADLARAKGLAIPDGFLLPEHTEQAA